MRILITGANGLLGQKVTETFVRETDHELICTDIMPNPSLDGKFRYLPLDITGKEDVKKTVLKHEPNVIVNAAAFTNVDACETERELCWRVNVDAVKNLIIAARKVSAKVIHISSDYVFDGKSGNYDEDSVPSPQSFYGKSKLASENALISSVIEYAIIRTMILYGVANNVRPNFATWLVDKLVNDEPVKVVDDQLGHPTVADDVALAVLQIIEKNCSGIYHVCGSECVSRYKFALKLADIFEFEKNLIIPIKTSELQQAAARPMNSSFITLKAESELGIKPMNVSEGLYFLKHQLGL
jgi:dTDP-4-dehydrorhamnose reductase